MAVVSLDLPIIGNNNSTEDPKLRSNFSAIQTAINGNLNADNILPADADKLGLSYTGVVHRGKSIIATEETRTNAAYGTLTTPDRVQNIVLPTDGLIAVAYTALFKCSVSGAGRAAIFVGANQLKGMASNSAPTIQECSSANATNYDWLLTVGGGLSSLISGTSDASSITTGLAFGWGASGGPAWIFAAAGTYDISIQFKSATGTCSLKDRRLWVWTTSF